MACILSAVENCSCLWLQEHGSDEAALGVVIMVKSDHQSEC